MHKMVVNRRYPRDDDGSPLERAGAFRRAQNCFRVQRMALDGKLLARSDGFPAEVARFRECTHLMGRFRKTSGIWLEPPREEFAVRPGDHRLELAHVYVVFFYKRRDLSLTPAGVLQSCN